MNDQQPPLCNVAILAGGMGTRLKSRTGDIPKPMALLLGKPVLEHLIDLCRESGFTKIALLVGYGHKLIQEYFGDGSRFGVSLTYCVEATARGTAGALNDALHHMAPKFFVLYGDTYASVDLKAMKEWHDAQASQATLFLHPNDHPEDSDLVSVDTDHNVTAIHPYPRSSETFFRNLVNAALYIFERDIVKSALAEVSKGDLAKHALPRFLSTGIRIKGYISPEYIKDMGTPDRLDRVLHHISIGLPDRLSTRTKRIAVFLDRDGTINKEVGHLADPDQLELVPGAASAIRRLNLVGMLAIIVTNQPVIARGELDYDGLERIHARLETLLGREGAYVDAIYYCPHHPDQGFEGERPELKIACDCRKPAIGMIRTAQQQFNINLTESWMVGDTTADILAGKQAGLKTILVATGQSGHDGKYVVEPFAKCSDICSAIEDIILASTDAGIKVAL